MAEIRSVFKNPMKQDSLFRFDILQMSGGDRKSLSVPVTSASFKWTASAVSGKTKKSTIYIMAREKLKVLLLNSKGLRASVY